MKKLSTNQKAFTLIEMAVVLMILSVIAGGILVGTSIVANARAYAVVAEVQEIRQKFNLFKTKYNALPGDMMNATDFWYNATTCPGTSNTAGQCNGNGNGLLDYAGGTDSDESIRAWQHLYLAGFVETSYTGVHTVSGQNDIGINVPASKLTPNGYSIWTVEPYYNALSNYLMLAGFVGGYFTAYPINLTTFIASDVDNKIDDGMPRTGNVKGTWSDEAALYWGTGWNVAYGFPRCVIGSTGKYDFSTSRQLCTLGFQLIGN